MGEKSAKKDRLSPDKVRICITPTREVVSKIDELAAAFGMSRSATCNFIICQGLQSYDAVKSFNKEQIEALANFMVPKV